MIPCQDCGYVNPLGTLFCHQCGSQLDIHLSQLQQSVNQTAADKRSEAVFTAGKNAANLSVFLLITTLIYRFFLLPGHLPPGYPAVAPIDLRAIFTEAKDFEAVNRGDGSTLTVTATPTNDLVDAEGDIILAKWRNHEKEILLGPVDLYATANCQIRIANLQDQHSHLWSTGSDRLTASGLALLALQAYPLRDVQPHLARGLKAIKAPAMASSDDKSPGRVLALLALLEADALDRSERVKAIRICSSQAETAKWCALAQISIPPRERLPSMAILRNNVKDIVWQHLLEPFSDKPVLPEDDDSLRTVFTEDFARRLDAVDRIAWTNAAWRLGVDLPLLEKLLHEWSSAKVSKAAPEDLAALAGDKLAADALAVLANTAALRAPAVWLVDRKQSD